MSSVKPQSFEELVTRYGKPWVEPVKFEGQFMTLWRAETLAQRLKISATELPIPRIYCNRELIPTLDMAFTLLHADGLAQEITTFDGCWCVRPIRGVPVSWSIHSFGLAIDFNAAKNPLGGPVVWSQKFLADMEEAGFTLGANFSRKDGMHFQWADNC